MEPTETLFPVPDQFASEAPDDTPGVGTAPEEALTPSPEDVLAQRLAEAQAREAELNRRLDDERARFDRFLESAPSPAQAAPQPPPPVPDPLADPEAFSRYQADQLEMRSREMEERLTERLQGVQSRLSEQQQLDSLWHDFQVRYPDMASLDKLAGYAFTEVTGGKIPSETSGLIDRVHDKMLEMAGGERLTPKSPNRTGGVSGGNASAPTPPKPSTPEEEPVSSFADEIHKWQSEQGYI